MTSTDLERALDRSINKIAEITDEELLSLQSLIERAHVHIMIERHLRSRVASSRNPLRSVT